MADTLAWGCSVVKGAALEKRADADAPCNTLKQELRLLGEGEGTHAWVRLRVLRAALA